ncbi:MULTISPECIES: glycerophosphodiester phosphodiesterase family protein [unclassified Actinobaculum]|uniref:glycerophosphodiester phosphodiesterase family protein n=1 Tax=unclassified Actinobaculum TaxID=2609299 RepID=UPI001F0CD511|nr:MULTISPECIES: glycerophosphodiester phosphodiesterase family protein [unclassified Actinobaculum]
MKQRIYRPDGIPLILAHRGGANEHPENSAQAFEAARAAGFRHIETDAHVTRDDVAVLCHDPELDRTAGGSGEISAYRWNELSRLRDASGGRMMRVDEVLDTFPEMIFNIDAKTDAVTDPLISAIRRTGAEARVCLASFNERRLKRIRRALPQVATSLGVGQIARYVGVAHLPAALRRQFVRFLTGPQQGVQAAQVPLHYRGVAVLTPALVETAHTRGVAVHAWTINDIDTAARLLSYGVDGIITDEPSAMRDQLAARGITVEL